MNNRPQSARLFVVIAYDVVSDRRRLRIFKTLKNHGKHVQYSVFECELRRADFLRLHTKLERLINPDEDSIRFYFLDRDAVAQIEHMGVGPGPGSQMAYFQIF